MIIQRLPALHLRPFIKLLWASAEAKAEHFMNRERLLPTGHMHIVFRLSDEPIRIFESVEDIKGQIFGCAVFAGLRSRYYVKDVYRTTRTVGALLQPGAAQVLIGAPADEFAERHTSIEALWGRHALNLREQLKEENNLQKQLDLFELFLGQKIPQFCKIHPAVDYALKSFPVTDISQIIEKTGYSHKQFIKLFRSTVGLTPKLYCRILRFQRVLKLMREQQFVPVDIALQTEYSDQAHFNREFRDFTGLTPGEYRNLSLTETHHVPLYPLMPAAHPQIR